MMTTTTSSTRTRAVRKIPRILLLLATRNPLLTSWHNSEIRLAWQAGRQLTGEEEEHHHPRNQVVVAVVVVVLHQSRAAWLLAVVVVVVGLGDEE